MKLNLIDKRKEMTIAASQEKYVLHIALFYKTLVRIAFFPTNI